MQPINRKWFGVLAQGGFVGGVGGLWSRRSERWEYVLKDGPCGMENSARLARSAITPSVTAPDSDTNPKHSRAWMTICGERSSPSGWSARFTRRRMGRWREVLIRQRAARGGSTSRSNGQPLRIEPFDGFGRRIFTMTRPRVAVAIVKGITEQTRNGRRLKALSTCGK